ncbi:AraC family transcriptional regulator [Cohnella panacarvi]|uniref:AraC family transcriptional regulator n=1 Tax=Cohnella panacarvi TaxID=400776 RepID=UPI00047E80D7|nr:helix-turn-helix transcriptional regulator [Cohnella panacarvi]
MLRRFVAPIAAEQLPLQIETVGLTPHEEYMNRPDGYPCFHWLHTIEGEGEMHALGTTWKLPEGTGFLLYPNVPHVYSANNGRWHTAYLTFTGSMAAACASALFGNASAKFQWDESETGMTDALLSVLDLAESGQDPAGWRNSAELYRFLTLLKTHGTNNQLPSLSKRLERLQQLLAWLEIEYANPDVGLAAMAAQLGIGARQLNERFKESFGQPAYAYLITLRLRKAKEWLPSRPEMTVRQIGEAVGFRDASHFIATFRQKEGMTPEKYRKLHGPSS